MNAVELEREADRLLSAAGFDPESPSEPPDPLETAPTWELVSEPLRRAAEAACTERQLEALKLSYAGLDREAIGAEMGVSPQRAGQLVQAAYGRIEGVLELGVSCRTLNSRGPFDEG